MTTLYEEVWVCASGLTIRSDESCEKYALAAKKNECRWEKEGWKEVTARM